MCFCENKFSFLFLFVISVAVIFIQSKLIVSFRCREKKEKGKVVQKLMSMRAIRFGKEEAA